MTANLENKIDSSSDIEIRTMKSDIEAIKAGGGDVTLVSAQSSGGGSENQSPMFKTIIFFVIIILAIVGIGFFAYYLALKFIK